MSQISRYDLLQAVLYHDADELRSLLRKAKLQHIPLSDCIYPTLSEIIRCLYRHYPQPGKEPYAERCWQVLPDVACEILELLRPFYDFDEDEKLYQNHFLYQPVLHGDVRMLEYLWTLEPMQYRRPEYLLGQIFSAGIEDFCYMRLPDWEGLPHDKKIPEKMNKDCYSLDLSEENWLETLYIQAERCHIAPPAHLEFLLKHDCMLSTSELKLRIHQPRLEFLVQHSDRPGFGRLWEIQDQWIDHRNQDCGELVKACLRDGSYWPLTCVCGFPECARVHEPVLALRFGDVARWRITSSEDKKKPSVYYRAVPVKKYLRDMDMLLDVVEHGIREDGFVPPDAEAEPDRPITYFSATPNSLKKVKTVRKLIRCALEGKKIPEFEKKRKPITIVVDE